MQQCFALGCILALFFLAQSGRADDGADWEALNGQSTGLYREQQFIKAAAAGRVALAKARTLPADEREKLAVSLGNLAIILTHLGSFPEAEELAKEELAVRRQHFGPEDLGVLPAWNHLALIYTLAGNLKRVNPDAEQCLLQILAIEEQARGRDNPAIAPALRRLEKYYRVTGNEERGAHIRERLQTLGEPEEG